MLLVAAALALAACARERAAGSGGPLFTLLPSSTTGVTFANALPENAMRNGFTYEYYYNGGGVAVGDLNGDGLPDLYFIGNMVSNRLYLNRGGLHFEDVTDKAGVRGLEGGWATGVTLADVNGDGRLDIYVSQSGPFADPNLRRNLLYINEGNKNGIPVFEEEAARYGLDDPGYSTQAVFFDCDGDGDLDMYLMNAGIPGYRNLEQLLAGHSPNEVDKLYRNDGGHFVDVSAQAGLVDTNAGFGLGVAVGDLNNDGRPDLYVANDYSGRDYLYLGQGDCRFKEVLKKSMGHTPFASMGVDIADVDGDGWLDLMTLDMNMPTHYDRAMSDLGTHGARFDHVVAVGQGVQHADNAFQWNRGTGPDGVPVFSEIANVLGVTATDWSWAPLVADFDDDGRPDLFVSNGIVRDMINRDFRIYRERRVQEVVQQEGHVTPGLIRDLLSVQPHRKVPNRIFQNEGDLTFSDRTTAWGLGQPSYSNGAVYADLDGDGDLDLVVNNLMGEAAIYRNNANKLRTPHHWLEVRLDGAAPNRFGVGARVRLVAGGTPQVQEMEPERGYLSSVQPGVLHFGLGAAERVDTLAVRWPDGARQVLTEVGVDRDLTLSRRAAHTSSAGASVAPAAVAPLFHDATALLSPAPRGLVAKSIPDTTLRPYPTRRDGAAVAVGDVDGDGLADLFVGGGGGKPSRLYLQRPDGTLRGIPLPGVDRQGERITNAVFFDANGDGRADLWVTSLDTLARGKRPTPRHRLWLGNGKGRFHLAPAGTVPDVRATGSVLAPVDFDGDGDIDLLVGDRVDPDLLADSGVAAGTRLLRNDGGVFHDVTAEVAPALLSLRTVNDAVWTDVNGDGTPDCVVVGDWMPPTVLLNEGGRLQNATAAAGLDSLTGWWQSVAATDVDGDGDMDLVVGNMGLDYPYRPSARKPFSLYVGAFGQSGRRLAVPAFFEGDTLYPWYDAQPMVELIPSLAARFPTNRDYALASLPKILGAARLRSALRLSVATTASMYLQNDGKGHFRARPLPRAAQISPITGIVPADFDGDGRLDLVVAGNLYELDSTVQPQDAGVGLFLKGGGKGGFTPVMPQRSGLLLPGPVERLLALTRGSSLPPDLVVVGGGAPREAVVFGRYPLAVRLVRPAR